MKFKKALFAVIVGAFAVLANASTLKPSVLTVATEGT